MGWMGEGVTSNSLLHWVNAQRSYKPVKIFEKDGKTKQVSCITIQRATVLKKKNFSKLLGFVPACFLSCHTKT